MTDQERIKIIKRKIGNLEHSQAFIANEMHRMSIESIDIAKKIRGLADNLKELNDDV